MAAPAVSAAYDLCFQISANELTSIKMTFLAGIPFRVRRALRGGSRTPVSSLGKIFVLPAAELADGQGLSRLRRALRVRALRAFFWRALSRWQSNFVLIPGEDICSACGRIGGWAGIIPSATGSAGEGAARIFWRALSRWQSNFVLIPGEDICSACGRIGGWAGIRTLGSDKGTHAFQACAFDHSATHPERICETNRESGV